MLVNYWCSSWCRFFLWLSSRHNVSEMNVIGSLSITIYLYFILGAATRWENHVWIYFTFLKDGLFFFGIFFPESSISRKRGKKFGGTLRWWCQVNNDHNALFSPSQQRLTASRQKAETFSKPEVSANATGERPGADRSLQTVYLPDYFLCKINAALASR